MHSTLLLLSIPLVKLIPTSRMVMPISQLSPAFLPNLACVDQRLAALPGFPKFVVVALAHVISYLSDFDIAGPLSTAVFNKFTSSSHMLLAGNTLANLEIFRNETDLSTKGSLM
jgi:hypothetical protein